MVEAEKPKQYTLEFVLTYDNTKKEIKFTGLTDDTMTALRAIMELGHLNNSFVSTRGDNGTKIGVTIYKQGKIIPHSELSEDFRRQYGIPDPI